MKLKKKKQDNNKLDNKLNKLIEAVKGKKKVRLTYYDDPDDKERLVYPHTIYKKDKMTLMDAYQIEGGKGKFPKWKDFDVNKIKSFTVLTEEFKIVKTFDPRSEKYTDVFIVVNK